MQVRQKRFQYWSSTNGIPVIKWTEWFDSKGLEDSIQLKGFKGNNLLNEYRTIEK